MIRSPKLPLIHPDRPYECEQAIEDEDFALLDRGLEVRNEEFRLLALRAKAAGWTGDEVGVAMLALAEKYVARRAHQNQGRAEMDEDQGPGVLPAMVKCPVSPRRFRVGPPSRRSSA